MKIMIISDAWHPQINGVVRTLEATVQNLQKLGHEVQIIGPDSSRWCTIAAPTYPDIKLEFFARLRLRRLLNKFQPDFLHVATEGPLGWAARNLCLQLRRPFTTSYHTRFPEYFAARMPRLLAPGICTLLYAVLRRFHAPSSAVMVATSSIENLLRKQNFCRIARWSRGVDTDLFRPYGKALDAYVGLPRPILLYVCRVAIEKNIRAFLDLDMPGSKIVIGNGPDLELLIKEYPKTHFLGVLEGEVLARHYAAVDLFVFPSSTDTFGLVLLEACAAGLRIASYPAPGPADVFADQSTNRFASLDTDLGRAIKQALSLFDDPTLPRRFAETFSWPSCTKQFLHNLQASTPQAVKRITRFRAWLGGWYKHFDLKFINYNKVPRSRRAQT